MHDTIGLYLEYLQHNKRASAHTLSAYARDLEDLAGWLLRDAQVTEWKQLDHRHIRSFLAMLHSKRQASSVARTLSAIRSFLKYCVKEGHLNTSPADLIISPKVPRHLPSGLSVDQAFALCDEDFEVTRLTIRDEAIIELLYATGIRVSEACGLNIGSVDLHAKVVTVLGKGNKERIVPFHDKCAKKMREWMEIRLHTLGESSFESAPFFVGTKGNRLNDRVLRKMLTRCGLCADINGTLHPHRFRHAFGTHMMESGANLRTIQEFLGHASISTTQQYTQVNLTHLMKVYDSSHPHSKKSK